MSHLGLGMALALGIVIHAPAAPTASDPDVTVTLDRSTMTIAVGDKFTLSSSVDNEGGNALAGAIAHLNILSVDPDVYVDPEDWSGQRTQYLAEIPAHTSMPVTWSIQGVNSGTFLIYVAVTQPAQSSQVVSGPALRLSTSQRTTLNPGGSLPVALGVPVGILALMALTALRRRRRRA